MDSGRREADEEVMSDITKWRELSSRCSKTQDAVEGRGELDLTTVRGTVTSTVPPA